MNSKPWSYSVPWELPIVPRSDYYALDLVNVHNLPSPQGIEFSIKNGIGIMPTMTLTEALKDTKPFNTLFIPGGLSIMHLLKDPMLVDKISILVDRAPRVFTVGAGSLMLAATGRLDDYAATCDRQLFDEAIKRCKSHALVSFLSFNLGADIEN